MRSVVVAALVLACGCGGRQECLRGGTPSVGRPAIDESYGFVRREWRRAHAADSTSSPVVRGRILERLPGDILDASDLAREPTCTPELVARTDTALFGDRAAGTPLVFDRMLVARVRAVGRVHDTTDVMDAKAAFLIEILGLADADLTDYRLAPDEVGPAPAKSYLRYLALHHLARANLYMNTEAARALAARRLAAPRDDRERLLMTWWAHQYFDRFGQKTPDLRDIWIADIRRRLHGPADPIGVELAIDYLAILGEHAGPHTRTILELCNDILAVRGRVPLAGGVAAAERDLLRAAIATRYDVGRDRGGGFIPPLSPLRTPVGTDWIDGEPAGGRVTPRDTRRRLADLDGELARLQHGAARCLVLAELARWVPAADGDHRFDALTAPLFDGDTLRFDRETMCRIDAALALDGVSPDRRAKLLVRLLAPDAPVAPYDARHDRGMGMVVLPDRGELPLIAARAIARHPDWLDTDAELARAVVAIVRAPTSLEHDQAQLQHALAPVLGHLLAGPEGGALARAWLASMALRPADGPGVAARPDVHSTYTTETLIDRMLALAEAAPALGLAGEAKTVFAGIAALPQPSPGTRFTHQAAVRAATIAGALLD